jgi:hypothetical protein
MRSVIVSLCAFAALAVCGARAETTSFPGGTLDVTWSDDASLCVEIVLDAPPPQTEGTSLAWVLTVGALRFPDGVYSWQLHISPTYQSAIVIPNDFLLTRRFTLQQLGIVISAWEPGRVLAVRIPRSGVIPELVAPGDSLDVHALWIQEPPLVSVLVPASIVASGAGAAEDFAEPASYVPPETVYARGATISYAFPLVEENTGAPVEGGCARIALVQVKPGLADSLIAYLYAEPEPQTGLLSYTINTADLAPGQYELIVWVSPPGVTVRQTVEIVPASP